MPQTYGFQVSWPVTDLAPRNRFVNHFHMEHVAGSLLNTDLESMCADIVALWQARYGNASHEVTAKAYDTDAVPNYPRAEVTVNAGSAWGCTHPREIALCCSFAGTNRGNKNERGRMYTAPILLTGVATDLSRPSLAVMTWALEWFSKSNESLPDLGGVDWKFGIWSRNLKHFTQAQQAWVDDEWDTQRSRGLRETTRLTSTREG